MRYLSDVAQAEYKRLQNILIEEGRWDDTFEAVLAAFAQAHADWIEATEKLRTTGAVVRDVQDRMLMNPWVAAQRNAFQTMLSSAGAMGFTLVSHRQAERSHDSEIPLDEYGDLFDDPSKRPDPEAVP